MSRGEPSHTSSFGGVMSPFAKSVSSSLTKIAWDWSETTSVAKRVVLELAAPEQSRPTRPLSANAAILLRRKRTDTELDMS